MHPHGGWQSWRRPGSARSLALIAGLSCLLLRASEPRAAALPASLIPAPRAFVAAPGHAFVAPGCRVRSEHPTADAYAIRVLEGALAMPPARGAGAPRRGVSRIVLREQPVAPLPAGVIAEQSYAIRVCAESVLVTGPSAAARMYGAQTLRQWIQLGGGELPCGETIDGPALAVRAVSLDISRGRRPTREDFLQILDACAAFKLDMVQLYIENTFPFTQVPRAAIRGYIVSPAELRALSREARLRSIDLVPIVETLAHQERMLSQPDMRAHSELNAPRSAFARALWPLWRFVLVAFDRAGIHPGWLARPSGMFAVTNPPTQRLVSSMVDDVLQCTGARAVHIGCDEAGELGLGASAERARRDGANAVFAAHVNRLAARARSRWNATTWLYADFVLKEPSLLRTLPPDAVLVDWHYQPESDFKSLDTLAVFGARRIVTSCGLWNWSAIYPEYGRAFDNIRRATDAARSRGCLGSVLASWGDGGGEDLFGGDLPGIAYFADCGWSALGRSADEFLPAYCGLRFGSTSGPALVALRALTRVRVPNVGLNQRLVYRQPRVRLRTAAWRDSIRQMDTALREGSRALAYARAADVGAAGELQAMRCASERFLAATARELVLDSLAARIDSAQRPGASRSSAPELAASLRRVARMESRAQQSYLAAWNDHNELSEQTQVRARLRGLLTSLDSLQAVAAAGRLTASDRFASEPAPER